MIKTFDKENVLLRGMVLKNTEYVVCIALLTGNKTVALFGQNESRLFSKKSKPKVSRLEKQLNRVMFALVILVLLLTTVFALVSHWYERHYLSKVYN